MTPATKTKKSTTPVHSAQKTQVQVSAPVVTEEKKRGMTRYEFDFGAKISCQTYVGDQKHGTQSYVYSGGFHYFLSKIKDGDVITCYTVPIVEGMFNLGNFNKLMHLGIQIGAVDKDGGRYEIINRQAFVDFWNAGLDDLKA